MNNAYFPSNVPKAISKGCQLADEKFYSIQQFNKIDRSGSCAIIAILVDDILYVANVGDSRAFVSESGGKIYKNLSEDHKPESLSEKKRILQNGGDVQKIDKQN